MLRLQIADGLQSILKFWIQTLKFEFVYRCNRNVHDVHRWRHKKKRKKVANWTGAKKKVMNYSLGSYRFGGRRAKYIQESNISSRKSGSYAVSLFYCMIYVQKPSGNSPLIHFFIFILFTFWSQSDYP